MYPYSSLPNPLSAQTFYVLLVLARSELHPYAIKGAVRNDSLGAVTIDTGRIYRLVEDLHSLGFIDLTGTYATNKGSALRKHYRISEKGTIRLKEEIIRLAHALKIAENAGLTETDIPLDIQKMLLELNENN